MICYSDQHHNVVIEMQSTSDIIKIREAINLYNYYQDIDSRKISNKIVEILEDNIQP